MLVVAFLFFPTVIGFVIAIVLKRPIADIDFVWLAYFLDTRESIVGIGESMRNDAS